MVLLAIDSAYLGYYSKNFREIHKKWLVNVLQLKDLYSILTKYTEDDFKKIIKKYNLKGRIWIDKEGYLQTNIKLDELSKIFEFPIELPKQKFIKSRDFQYEIREAENLINIDVEKIVSVARTRLNEVKISIAY
jgi:L-arabinose isomerase